MKMPTNYLALLTTLLLSGTSIGPHQALPADTKTKPTENSGGDTIYFSLPFRYAYNDSIPGIGRTLLPDIGYVLVRSNNRVVSWKYVSYCNSDCSGFLSASSDWLYIDNDTLFFWLSKNLERIRNEELHPFIYQVKEHNRVYYEQQERYGHGNAQFFISISSSGRQIRKNIDPFRTEAQVSRGSMKNLNYQYNTNTKLYRLYRMLEQRFRAWDMKYTFSRVK